MSISDWSSDVCSSDLRGFVLDPEPLGIIFELVAADARDDEILAFGMPEIKAADRGGRQHRKAFSEYQPGILARREQIEQNRFQAVIGAGGIAGSRADAAILLLDQCLVGQLLAQIGRASCRERVCP